MRGCMVGHNYDNFRVHITPGECLLVRANLFSTYCKRECGLHFVVLLYHHVCQFTD